MGRRAARLERREVRLDSSTVRAKVWAVCLGSRTARLKRRMARRGVGALHVPMYTARSEVSDAGTETRDLRLAKIPTGNPTRQPEYIGADHNIHRETESGIPTRNTRVHDELVMHQVVQPMKYPECTHHDRRLTDALKREDQPDDEKRSTVNHFLDAHSLLTGV